MLAGRDRGLLASRYLAGCIECGACHDACPTGVRFATARRAHRAATESLDRAGFDQRAAELTDLVARDPGAQLVIRGIQALLAEPPPSPHRSGPLMGGMLVLPGLMLTLAAPSLISQLEAKLAGRATPIVRDLALSTALDRASGLLLDVGMSAEHDRAIAQIGEIVRQRGYQQVSIAVLDPLSLRLRNEPLPPQLRIVPAAEIFPFVAAAWDDCAEDSAQGADVPGRFVPLPAEHCAANAPVLLNRRALASLWKLIEAKRDWLDGRTLITPDARNLVRFAGARHPAELHIIDSRHGAGEMWKSPTIPPPGALT
jgi:ferredoxin